VILLDTHAWVWWASGSAQLSAKAKKVLAREKRLMVSAISCWEISTLVRLEKLKFDRPAEQWIEQSLADPMLECIEISSKVAVLAGSLNDFHGDPADRLIVATAQALGCNLVTKDRKITDYLKGHVIW